MDLVQMLTERLGVSGDQAQQGAGLLFKKLQENLGDGDFSKIRDAVPDMDSLLGAAPEAEAEDSGGLLGMVGGAASKLGLGGVGDLADMTAGFDKIGLDASKLGDFASTILEFIEEKLGVDGRALVEKFFK